MPLFCIEPEGLKIKQYGHSIEAIHYLSGTEILLEGAVLPNYVFFPFEKGLL